MKGPVSGFVGTQRWTAEFKGIMQPVLFMIEKPDTGPLVENKFFGKNEFWQKKN